MEGKVVNRVSGNRCGFEFSSRYAYDRRAAMATDPAICLQGRKNLHSKTYLFQMIKIILTES